MSSLNKVMIIGNLGRDPEVRKTSGGDSVVSFSLACSESWRDKSTGDRKERTEWVNIVIFNESIGKVAEQYCKKGSKIYIEGALQTRKWQDKDGNDRYTTEVVLQKFRGELKLLGGKNESGDGDGESRSYSSSRGTERKPAGGGGAPIDDDIPFLMEWRG
jgi:single-strand DNA-binding protein